MSNRPFDDTCPIGKAASVAGSRKIRFRPD